MKKSTLALLVTLITFSCFSQSFPKKQTLIPLSNVNGVPFFKAEDMNDIGINGFEVDDKGNFYFMSGNTSACLAVFSGNKQIYRKVYKQFPAGQLYVFRNQLYTFDRMNNDLYAFNLLNGSIVKWCNQISTERVDDYIFADSSLIFNFENTSFERYNLKGKHIGKSPTAYNIAPSLLPDKDAEFLGKWNDNYVFDDLIQSNNGRQYLKYWLVDKSGKILATRSLLNAEDTFGQIYFENPEEHRKVRNNSLYIFAHSLKGDNALVTEVPLQTFFNIH